MKEFGRIYTTWVQVACMIIAAVSVLFVLWILFLKFGVVYDVPPRRLY